MARIELIQSICADHSVLDVGCYGDRTAYNHPDWLHDRIRSVASDVTGIDVNETGIKELQRDGYSVHHADAETFQLDESFEVIVAAEVIEHLSNPGAFLDRAQAHIEADGQLVITTPNLHSLFILGAYLLPVYNEREHTIGFTRSILKNLLDRCGWSVDRMTLTTHEAIPQRATGIVNAVVPQPLNFTIFCVASPTKPME